MLTLSRITILGVAVLQALGAQCTASWSETLGGIGTNGAINALAVFDDGNTRALVAAGSFTSAGGGAATRVAAWSSGKWQALGPGGPTAAFPLSLTVKAVHVHDDGSGPAVYVGGTFSSSGGVVTSGIARWNGSWSGVGGEAAAKVPSRRRSTRSPRSSTRPGRSSASAGGSRPWAAPGERNRHVERGDVGADGARIHAG